MSSRCMQCTVGADKSCDVFFSLLPFFFVLLIFLVLAV